MANLTAKLKQMNNLRKIFEQAVQAVRPHNLLHEANGFYMQPKVDEKSNSITIQIQGKTLDLTNKKCHVVGFGKAVLGMAAQLEKQLGAHIAKGILSIPQNSLQQFHDVPEMCLKANSCFQVYEGAANNQPDEVAMKAAKEIKNLAASMTEKDILFVLISGGGSALLPLPKQTISLEEKMQLVRKLSNSGATINELNVVRIALSDIKGGRLAAAAHNAHAVISFVISDIVGDNPVDLIASGPTCAALSKRISAAEILQKHQLWQDLPQHIRHVIKFANDETTTTQPARNNMIFVVGDNRVATAAAVQSGLECGYNPFITSTTITGDITLLVEMYRDFLKSIYSFRHKEIDAEKLKQHFPFDTRIFQHFLKTLLMCEKTAKPILIIIAGEPTVKLTGTGVGGRNQELALRMSLELYENTDLEHNIFLSAGTDGIDGPTPAAGAIGCKSVVDDYLQHSKTLKDFKQKLLDNDSYNFFKNLENGKYHIITGHTGTNVMDLHLMLVP